jgi:hypothetical protein
MKAQTALLIKAADDQGSQNDDIIRSHEMIAAL